MYYNNTRVFSWFMLYLSTFLQKNEKIFFKMLVILEIIRIFAPCK